MTPPVWDERRLAMLEAMGIRLWRAPVAMHPAEIGPPVRVAQVPAAPASKSSLPPDGVLPSSVSVMADAVERAATTVTAETGRRSVGIEAMGWPALREAVAQCRACSLCSSRRQTVFGVGNPQAHWMLVGEAPGEQEDRLGEPFVGKAGQLLDNMLAAVGLTRQEAEPARQVYIANVLKCRPPANRNPEPQEVAQCEPFLKRQVELVAPRLILAMGRFAVQSLLGSHEPIGRLRGKVHHYHGVPLVVTYHPAYLLRNPLDKARSWEDLCLAREVVLQAAERGAAP